MRSATRVFFLSTLLFFPALVFASLIFFPADGRKKRDNPADERGSNYQGYGTTNGEQNLQLLDADALASGSTNFVDVTNWGWKPTDYRMSEDSTFGGVDWLPMPSTRILSKRHSGTPGNRTMYVALRTPDKKESSFSVPFSFQSRSIFVDGVSGSETNAGTSPDGAVATLTNAYSLALRSNFSTVFIRAGGYNRVSGLNTFGDGLVITNSNLRFSFGWNASFTAQTNYSILDAQGAVGGRTILVQQATNIIFERCVVKGGNQTLVGSRGGGLMISNASYVIFTNCGFYNNQVYSFGGGAMVQDSHHVIIAGSFEGNTSTTVAGGGGGGLAVSNSYSMIFLVSMISNSAYDNGTAAAFFGPLCTGITFTGLVITNVGSAAVARTIFIKDAPGITIQNTVITNNLGHGLWLEYNIPVESSLVIKGNLFGVPTPNGANHYYGIYEGMGDISSHTVLGNYFATNQGTNIYRDFSGSLITTGNFPLMNTPGDPFHDATTAANNVMTNF